MEEEKKGSQDYNMSDSEESNLVKPPGSSLVNQNIEDD